MRDILSKIVEHKKQDVAKSQKRLPESQIREQALMPRTRRSFLKRLEHPGATGVNVIAEIKRASPSKGVICQNLDPVAYASEYEKGGAAALSVLTDQLFFQGSSQDLKSARETTTLPVLRKDFMSNPSNLRTILISAMNSNWTLWLKSIRKRTLKQPPDPAPG